MKKSKTKNLLIVLLIVLLLALGVGYAAFSDVLKISGTANANGTFDLEFQNVSKDSAIGCNAELTTAVIGEGKDNLNVTVKDLAYPGAGAQFSVDIVNVGTIPAKVGNVVPTNITGSEHIIIEGLDAINTSHPVVQPGDSCSLTFTVAWDADSTTELTDAEKNGIDFDLEIEYTQSTEDLFDGAPDHQDA